jgi:NADP-dependent 3-hydroxy acid dehydrogenase YdfG
MTKKTVFITGASSGIGKATAEKYASEGYRLILCARNKEKIDVLKQQLQEQFHVPVHVFTLDVRDRRQVESTIKSLPDNFSEIDILVNNAGLALGLEKMQDNAIEDWEEMVSTNITGLLYVTKVVLSGMLQRNKGHIVNIGSIAGIHAYPNGAVYCATKAAVKTLSDGLRQDVVDTPIRVTNIQPGLTETNFSIVRFHGDIERAKSVYQGTKPLTGEDIADVIFFATSVPSHVQICEITVTPTCQATGNVLSKK